ncbi:MAG: sugar transferase, partial [Verrucomicrobiota bacterium]
MARPKKTVFHYKSGYRRHEHHLNDIYNFLLALLLLVLSMPFILVIILTLWLREGRPIFYKGTRLGRDKEPFTMYKFRTLIKDAETHLQGELLGSRTELITPTGKFLRDTRLDELPQLWNVIRRDMDVIGPRPVRPEVYDKICRNIPYYDRRFKVRPGIIGLSQVFTPHSTPKEIRSMIDNTLVRKQEKFLWNFSILLITTVLMFRALVIQSGHSIYRK